METQNQNRHTGSECVLYSDIYYQYTYSESTSDKGTLNNSKKALIKGWGSVNPFRFK